MLFRLRILFYPNTGLLWVNIFPSLFVYGTKEHNYILEFVFVASAGQDLPLQQMLSVPRLV
jgi:hypothetical protein